MSYTVKIIDNDNGRVVTDESEAVAIIGAIVTKGMSMGVYSTSCGLTDCAMGIYTAQRVCEYAKRDRLEVAVAVEVIQRNEDKIPAVEMDLSNLKKQED